jgi:adenylate cyclase class 1
MCVGQSMFKAKNKSKAKNKITFSDIDAVRKRFLLLNRERLRRGEDCMRTNQRDFLDFLPLLFHINHPSLPGYVSKGTPAGICDYTPTQRALDAAKKHIHRFEYRHRAMPRYDILSMFLMGSSGTIAYSRKSDFDIWLCHQHDVPPEQLEELQQKATAIEEWADEQGLEVHFFLMDAEDFRQGKIVDLSSESSGSAQYYLLLEEFYRTSLLLAGRFPIWWLVPAEEEENYEEYVQNLYKSRLVHESEVIDFGGIPTLPAEEFFGAAVWQLFKGIDSPHKSLLKLMLMEVYAAEYPDIELLCLRFKKAIFDGEHDLDKIDPYLMLYKKLEEYLLSRNEEERLELVRRCFYFKVNQKLSQKAGMEYDWRRDLLRSMTNAWGWENEYLAVMDTRHSWKIKQVLSERSVLVRELTYTYQFLSSFAREHAQLAAINQQDLNALGRKLYAAFERKTGKVEIVNRGISQDVFEPLLTVYQVRQRGREGGWALLSAANNGNGHDPSTMIALKRGRHVIEVVAWGYFNGLIKGSTAVKVLKHASALDSRQVEEFVRSLEKTLPAHKIMETDIEALGRPVKVLQCVLVINLGQDPLTELRRSGAHLASNRTDAFSYGGTYGSLVGGVDQILLTSWKEVITSHFNAAEGLLECLSNYFRTMPPSKGIAPPPPTILCYTQNHAITIRQRVERLFDDLVDCFYGSREKQNNRFIFCVQRDYYVLSLEDDVLRYHRISDYAELLRYLSKGRQTFGHVVMDDNVISDNLLPLVFKFNKPGVVQFFFKRESNGQGEVYVVDENGSLFCQRHEVVNEECLLGHYSRFFDSVLQRQLFQLMGQGEEGRDGLEVEYYSVGRDRQGQYQVSRRAPHDPNKRGYTSIQVIASREDDSASAFTLYCDEKEFSSLEYGSNLFNEVADYILSKRKSRQPYPVYITDLDLTPEMFADYPAGHVPVVEFLNYKKSIESKLNEALASLKQIRPLRPR